MKEKSAKELSKVVAGDAQSVKDSENGAQAELESQKLSIDDTKRIKSKLELETLIQNQRRHPDSAVSNISIIAGIITILMILIILLTAKSITEMAIAAVGFIASLILTTYNFVSFKRNRKDESLRKKRIYELINEL